MTTVALANAPRVNNYLSIILYKDILWYRVYSSRTRAKNKNFHTFFFLEKVVTHYIDTLWKILECKDPQMQKILLYKEIYGSCVHFTGFDSGSPTSSVVCVSSVCWPHIWRGAGNWCYKSGLVGKKILILVFNLLLMRASVVGTNLSHNL